ncbi:MAG TPA: hypothetical protein VK168_04360 [Saprospiraceae bacterium]|nr:hypothetical protein [Saprospiraceae bacterium]
MRFLIFLFCPLFALAQPVADQTFKLAGASEHFYAFAEGDQVDLFVEELTSKKIKSVEFSQYPDGQMLYRAYELDSNLQKTIIIPRTGIYLLRFEESGLSKKVCRFTLHRNPGNPEMNRFDTQVNWDLKAIPNFRLNKRSVQSGKKTEVISLGGQSTVSASKFYLKKPVNAYQFTLPPNTKQWAYRIAVGQAAHEARQQDAQKLKQAFQGGAAKLMGVEPHTALAAFALGMAIDMSTSKAGEDVEYALVDWTNWELFSKGENYNAFISQGGISVDAQRRYSPLEGTYYFALKSDNWVDDITVNVDIEAVVEYPLFEVQWFLEPAQP